MSYEPGCRVKVERARQLECHLPEGDWLGTELEELLFRRGSLILSYGMLQSSAVHLSVERCLSADVSWI